MKEEFISQFQKLTALFQTAYAVKRAHSSTTWAAVS